MTLNKALLALALAAALTAATKKDEEEVKDSDEHICPPQDSEDSGPVPL